MKIRLSDFRFILESLITKKADYWTDEHMDGTIEEQYEIYYSDSDYYGLYSVVDWFKYQYLENTSEDDGFEIQV